MKHLIHSLEHPIKTLFLEQVYTYVDHMDIDQLINEYVLEGEHQDGVGYWNNFKNVSDVINDFKHFVEFADEGVYEE